MNFLRRYHSNETGLSRTLVLLVFFKKEKTFLEILLWSLLGVKGEKVSDFVTDFNNETGDSHQDSCHEQMGVSAWFESALAESKSPKAKTNNLMGVCIKIFLFIICSKIASGLFLS